MLLFSSSLKRLCKRAFIPIFSVHLYTSVSHCQQHQSPHGLFNPDLG